MSLFSASSEKEETSVAPKTGWNHNQPSESSAFWQGSESSEEKDQLVKQEEEPKEKLRTGWLHNSGVKNEEEASSSKRKATAGGASAARRRLQQAMKQQQRKHRITSPPAYHAIGNHKRAVVTEHLISLPLNRSDAATSQRIDVFFSLVEVVREEDEKWWHSLASLTPEKRAESYVYHASLKDATGMLLYLQGGPGFGSPTPCVSLGLSQDSSWAAMALDHYSRIVLMDQRGTGRSTAVTKQTLQKRFPNLFVLDSMTDEVATVDEFIESNSNETEKAREALQDATNYMACLRADNIVQDAEEIKDALLLPIEEEEDEKPRPLGAALGQSFGGFCMMTYLSQVDHPPRVCLLTGGIAPMLTPVYDAYNVLWERVKERNLKYYDMYPGDVGVVKKIVRVLSNQPASLPSGGRLTARRFLQLGLGLGGSPSAFASMHALLASAFLDRESTEFSKAFLKRIDSEQSFDDHPIYFLLHESIYADGSDCCPTNWAAHRAYECRVDKPSSEFDYVMTSNSDDSSLPTLFFGEMVFPWMADGDYAEVSGVGMKSLAQALAAKEDWTPLYDGEHMREVLDGRSKAAAAVYLEDLYVDFDSSMKVVKRGGPLQNCKVYVTNEYQHSGLRDDGAQIFEKLLGMAKGSIRTPS